MFKGVYLGEVTKNETEYYNLQFAGMLAGENRVLDVYINIQQESFPLVYEVDEMKSGEAEFLFSSHNCCFGQAETMLFKLFAESDTDYNDPGVFLNSANFNKSELSDAGILLAINYSDASDSSPVKAINIYLKNEKGLYSHISIFNRGSKKYSDIKLKYIMRNKTKMSLDKMMYVLTVMGDIVTSPFQLLVIAYIAIFGIW